MGVFYYSERPATLRVTCLWKGHNYRVVYIISIAGICKVPLIRLDFNQMRAKIA